MKHNIPNTKTGILENAASKGTGFLARLIDIDPCLDESGCLALPFLEITGKDDMKSLSVTKSCILDKSGYFSDYVLPEECSLLSLVKAEHTELSLPHEIMVDEDIISLGYCKTDISFEQQGGRLRCQVDILAGTDESTYDLDELSKECSARLYSYLQKRLCVNKTDIVGLFRSLRFKKPALYSKYSGRLYELYSLMDIDVRVTLFLDSGL